MGVTFSRREPMRTFITSEFIKKIGETGSLAEAAARLSSIDKYKPLANMSTWALVCEEIVDTEYSSAYYERVLAELYRRGLSAVELKEMRLFAWETAGWLNFEKMLWDWVSLDESDIERAIAWQLEDHETTESQAAVMRAYLRRYATGDAV
jgi:hypothetical protein